MMDENLNANATSTPNFKSYTCKACPSLLAPSWKRSIVVNLLLLDPSANESLFPIVHCRVLLLWNEPSTRLVPSLCASSTHGVGLSVKASLQYGV